MQIALTTSYNYFMSFVQNIHTKLLSLSMNIYSLWNKIFLPDIFKLDYKTNRKFILRSPNEMLSLISLSVYS